MNYMVDFINTFGEETGNPLNYQKNNLNWQK